MQNSKAQFKNQKFMVLFSQRSAKWRRVEKYLLLDLARSLLGFFLMVLLLLVFSGTVHAHTLKINGDFGVTVHINPDDAPKAGETSTIFVSIKDRSERFDERNPGNCTCILTISKDGEESAQLPIVSGNSYNTLSYSFPTSGSYTLTVRGAPNGKGESFEGFSTEYEYYVTSGQTNTFLPFQNPLRNYLPFVIVIVGLIILLLFVNPFSRKGV